MTSIVRACHISRQPAHVFRLCPVRVHSKLLPLSDVFLHTKARPSSNILCIKSAPKNPGKMTPQQHSSMLAKGAAAAISLGGGAPCLSWLFDEDWPEILGGGLGLGDRSTLPAFPSPSRLTDGLTGSLLPRPPLSLLILSVDSR